MSLVLLPPQPCHDGKKRLTHLVANRDQLRRVSFYLFPFSVSPFLYLIVKELFSTSPQDNLEWYATSSIYGRFRKEPEQPPSFANRIKYITIYHNGHPEKS